MALVGKHRNSLSLYFPCDILAILPYFPGKGCPWWPTSIEEIILAPHSQTNWAEYYKPHASPPEAATVYENITQFCPLSRLPSEISTGWMKPLVPVTRIHCLLIPWTKTNDPKGLGVTALSSAICYLCVPSAMLSEALAIQRHRLLFLFRSYAFPSSIFHLFKNTKWRQRHMEPGNN